MGATVCLWVPLGNAGCPYGYRWVPLWVPPTSPRYGGFDEGIQLFVAADRQLQMAGSDALHLQVLGGVACQLQDLRGMGAQRGASRW